MVGGLDTLFQPLALRGKTLKNRIFSTGHMAVMLDDGKPTARMVAYHEAKAQGGAALTIIEAACVHLEEPGEMRTADFAFCEQAQPA